MNLRVVRDSFNESKRQSRNVVDLRQQRGIWPVPGGPVLQSGPQPRRPTRTSGGRVGSPLGPLVCRPVGSRSPGCVTCGPARRFGQGLVTHRRRPSGTPSRPRTLPGRRSGKIPFVTRARLTPGPLSRFHHGSPGPTYLLVNRLISKPRRTLVE